jgi:hypothetical protein
MFFNIVSDAEYNLFLLICQLYSEILNFFDEGGMSKIFRSYLKIIAQLSHVRFEMKI